MAKFYYQYTLLEHNTKIFWGILRIGEAMVCGSEMEKMHTDP